MRMAHDGVKLELKSFAAEQFHRYQSETVGRMALLGGNLVLRENTTDD